jgi:hypothetical protein
MHGRGGGGGGDGDEPAASCIVSMLRMTSCVWVPLVVLTIIVVMMPDNSDPTTAASQVGKHVDFVRDPAQIAAEAYGGGGGSGDGVRGGEGGGDDVGGGGDPFAPREGVVVPKAPLPDGEGVGEAGGEGGGGGGEGEGGGGGDNDNAAKATLPGMENWVGTGDPHAAVRAAVDAHLDPALLREKLQEKLRAEGGNQEEWREAAKTAEAGGGGGTGGGGTGGGGGGGGGGGKTKINLHAHLDNAKGALEKLREGGASLEHAILSKGLNQAVASALGGTGDSSGNNVVDVEVDLRTEPPAPLTPFPPPPQPPAPFNSFNAQCLRNIKKSQVPFFERFYCRFNTFLKVDNPLKVGGCTAVKCS